MRWINFCLAVILVFGVFSSSLFAQTLEPTASPTLSPTFAPTLSPTGSPTVSPTLNPTVSPTTSPTKNPTAAPTTSPTKNPTTAPTTSPTKNPTTAPTTSPTKNPTTAPTTSPTKNPTTTPTESPTGRPTTTAPTTSPTTSPTRAPTKSPTKNPTTSPTTSPTKNPTRSPTTSPTRNPTRSPTTSPTKNPTRSPLVGPTVSPTTSPTRNPTTSPTTSPTKNPTKSPTTSPTRNPTKNPTTSPTKNPTTTPTTSPTKNPTVSPTTSAPTSSPTVSDESPVGIIVGVVFVFALLGAVGAFFFLRRKPLAPGGDNSKLSEKEIAGALVVPVEVDKRPISSGTSGTAGTESMEAQVVTPIVEKEVRKSIGVDALERAMASKTGLIEPGKVTNVGILLSKAESQKQERVEQAQRALGTKTKEKAPKLFNPGAKSTAPSAAQKAGLGMPKPKGKVAPAANSTKSLDADEAEFLNIMANNGKRNAGAAPTLDDDEAAFERAMQQGMSKVTEPKRSPKVEGKKKKLETTNPAWGQASAADARPESTYLTEAEIKNGHNSMFAPSPEFLEQAKKSKAMEKSQTQDDSGQQQGKKKKKKKHNTGNVQIDDDI